MPVSMPDQFGLFSNRQQTPELDLWGKSQPNRKFFFQISIVGKPISDKFLTSI